MRSSPGPAWTSTRLPEARGAGRQRWAGGIREGILEGLSPYTHPLALLLLLQWQRRLLRLLLRLLLYRSAL